MAHGRNLHVVHPACTFLAVPAYEGNGIPVLEHLYAVLDLPWLEAELGRYMADIYVFHQS